jgi:hypothetical protein
MMPRPDRPLVNLTGVALVLLGLIVVVWFVGANRSPDPTAEALDAERAELHAEAARVFADPRPPTDAEAAEFLELVVRFQAACRDHDADAFAALFDFDRMADELAAAGYLRARGEPDTPAARQQVAERRRKAVVEAWLETGVAAGWGEPTVVHVRRADDRSEAVVFTRHAPRGSEVTGLRVWWLTRRGGNWRIYDEGNAYTGSRYTRECVDWAAFARTPEETELFNRVEDTISDTYRTLGTNDLAGAEANLAGMADLRLPQSQRYERAFLEGMLRSKQGRPADAVERFDAALGGRRRNCTT